MVISGHPKPATPITRSLGIGRFLKFSTDFLSSACSRHPVRPRTVGQRQWVAGGHQFAHAVGD